MKLFKRRRMIMYREGPKWLERIREAISTRLLDFAEALPEVKSGYLHHLQRIRQRQRKKADQTLERYRLPASTQVQLLGFQLTEIFHLEDFTQLANSLNNLFPQKNQLYRNDFNEFHGKIAYGNWQVHGYIFPQGAQGHFPLEQSIELKGLADEIKMIELSTYQVMPSLISLIVNVQLKDSYAGHISKIINHKYVFPTKVGRYYRNLNFLTYSGISHLHSGAEDEFNKWSTTLQKSVEDSLRGHFFGEFQQATSAKPKLPRIDIFVVTEDFTEDSSVKPKKKKRQKADKKTLEEKEKARRQLWKDCIGLNGSPSYIDSGDRTQWIFADEKWKESWPARLVFDEEGFLKNCDISMYGDKSNAIWSNAKDWLLEICLPYSLFQYFQLERKNIIRLRELLLNRQNLHMKLRPGRILKLLAETEGSHIVMDRVLMEYEIVEDYVKRKLQGTADSFVSEFEKEWTLDQAFLRGLTKNKEVLERYNDYLQSTVTQIANVVNLRAARRMNLVTLIISIISLIVATLALQWNNIAFILQRLPWLSP